jgi:peptidoglycan hydrolase CwlO-like protein
MLRVEGHKNLYRNDIGAIVNTDTIEYNQYKRLKNKRQSEKDEIDRLKREIDDIKEMLKELKNP